MKTPLQPIEIMSIYKSRQNDPVLLPIRMAKCTPDTGKSILAIDNELRKLNGRLILSDLFRSYDMQLQSHNDYIAGRKTAFSPPPGGSMHEGGRGMDLDLKSINISLKDFWNIAANFGFYPVIDAPVSTMDEAWHFDCRGSHQLIYEYYKKGLGTNFKPYKAMAISAILAIDVRVHNFSANQKQAQLQAGLIRLGKIIGNIDGIIGRKTQRAIEELDLPFTPFEVDSILLEIENLLQQRFPTEYQII